MLFYFFISLLWQSSITPDVPILKQFHGASIRTLSLGLFSPSLQQLLVSLLFSWTEYFNIKTHLTQTVNGLCIACFPGITVVRRIIREYN